MSPPQGFTIEGGTQYEELKLNRPDSWHYNAVIGHAFVGKKARFFTFIPPDVRDAWEVAMSCMEGFDGCVTLVSIPSLCVLLPVQMWHR